MTKLKAQRKCGPTNWPAAMGWQSFVSRWRNFCVGSSSNLEGLLHTPAGYAGPDHLLSKGRVHHSPPRGRHYGFGAIHGRDGRRPLQE